METADEKRIRSLETWQAEISTRLEFIGKGVEHLLRDVSDLKQAHYKRLTWHRIQPYVLVSLAAGAMLGAQKLAVILDLLK